MAITSTRSPRGQHRTTTNHHQSKILASFGTTPNYYYNNKQQVTTGSTAGYVTSTPLNTFVIGSPEQMSAAFSLASILMLVTAGLLSLGLVAGTAIICTRWRAKHLDRRQRLSMSGRSALLSSASTSPTRTRTRTNSFAGKASLNSASKKFDFSSAYAEEDEANGKRIAGIIPSPNITLLRSETVKVMNGTTNSNGRSSVGHIYSNGKQNLHQQQHQQNGAYCHVTMMSGSVTNTPTRIWQPVSSGESPPDAASHNQNNNNNNNNGSVCNGGLFKEWYV